MSRLRPSWLAVYAVALGTFTLVTNEFLPVGLLTAIGADLHVSEGVAGTTMTVPGVVAAVAAPTLTVAAGRLDRRIALLAMTALFTVSDLLAAAASGFAMMLLARFLLGLGIGGFWAIGAGVGGRLAGQRAAVTATSVIFAGVSVASVIGVPAGAFIGGHFGWRTAFVAAAVLGVLALVLQLALLPRMGVDQPVTWRSLATVLRGPNARVGLATTLLLVIGQFTAYTYVQPFLERHTGASPTTVSTLLLVYGIAGIAGSLAAGAALERRLYAAIVTIIATLGLAALAMTVLGTTTAGAIIVLAIWGLVYGTVPVAMQTWIFTADRSTPEGGSALYISAFQISVAGGSLLGGRIVDGTGGSVAAMLTGGLLALTALALFVSLARRPAADLQPVI
ncbi:MFS transporter [Actinoplanes sp. L3-i22]|uniref:MFS transporter n=1 Tax=Actinoplanes sp. L3-i22 TaxID=2836373 RepID=UPI001C78B8FD|nr:MFS transporter [Actinoplanes sp. L3-i22]BCY09147.1 MFS transporter [Actinoplanes sp. L3-i22]